MNMVNRNMEKAMDSTDIGAGEWKQIKKNKLGITIHWRKVADSNFKEFRGYADFDTSLTSFAALMLDGDNMANWMHKTDVVRTVETLSENERIAYMAFDFSPLPNRDLVVRNKLTQDPKTLEVTYHMSFLEGHPTLKNSGLGHMKGLRGVAKAKPLDNGKIRFSYQTHIEPGAALLRLPTAAFVVNALLKATPFHTLKNASEEIVKDKYQNQTFSFIKNVS